MGPENVDVEKEENSARAGRPTKPRAVCMRLRQELRGSRAPQRCDDGRMLGSGAQSNKKEFSQPGRTRHSSRPRVVGRRLMADGPEHGKCFHHVPTRKSIETRAVA